MEKFVLCTWPDSQIFVSEPNCILICPPANAVDPTALDSSYMIPIEMAKPSLTERIFIMLDTTESQKWIEREGENDCVLFDYEGHAFVEESLLKTSEATNDISEKAPNPERFSVWVGGTEINDSLVTKEEAERIAKEWRKKGYDDVVIDEYK